MIIKPNWATDRVEVTYPSGGTVSYPMVAIKGTLYYWDVVLEMVINLDEVQWDG